MSVASWDIVENEHKQKIVRLSVKEQGSSSTHESKVEIFLYGAHITKWQESNQTPFLFLSDKALTDGSKAIRGGVPVIFPQFSGRGPMKSHGFARTSTWSLDAKTSSVSRSSGSSVSVTLNLTSGPNSDAWNGNLYTTAYTVTLSGAQNSSLSLAWRVENKNLKESFSFSNALHTYFNIGDIDKTVVEGLMGTTYIDQLDGGKEKTEEHKQGIPFTQEVDRIYLGVPSLIDVVDRSDLNRKISIEAKGFADAVVWNPWVAKSKRMGDFGDEEYKTMVCVENAVIKTEQTVEAQGSWEGSVKFSSSSLTSKL